MERRTATGLAGAAGALTIGAGLVHAAAASTHSEHELVVLLMATAALAQVAAGIAMLMRPKSGPLLALAAVNLAVAAFWLASRTTGIPLIAGLSEPEAVGVKDLVATLLEVAAAGSALAVLWGGSRARQPQLSPLWALAVVPTMLGMAAPHSSHGAGGHDGGHGAAQARSAAAQALATDPVFAGLDTSQASEAELKLSRDLIVETRDAVAAQLPDEAAVVAAGYRSIGDGFPFTSYEHFVHPGYMADGRELDPAAIESVVLESGLAGRRVVSAMYILGNGKTMNDIPVVGGDLTVWHDHQNLCWEDSGYVLAGMVINGACRPGGTFRPTAPMLHVWLIENQCGPFAGLEGHGTSCEQQHGH